MALYLIGNYIGRFSYHNYLPLCNFIRPVLITNELFNFLRTFVYFLEGF